MTRHEMTAEAYRTPATESALQKQIRQLGKNYGWTMTHHPYSIGADPGYPDLTCVHPDHPQTIWIECKGPKGRIKDAQIEYLELINSQMTRLGIVAWPHDLEAVGELLAGRPVDLFEDGPVLRVRLLGETP